MRGRRNNHSSHHFPEKPFPSSATPASISRRVYLRSLYHEYQFSFVLKLEIIIMTKIRTRIRFERETEGNSENGLLYRIAHQCGWTASLIAGALLKWEKNESWRGYSLWKVNVLPLFFLEWSHGRSGGHRLVPGYCTKNSYQLLLRSYLQHDRDSAGSGCFRAPGCGHEAMDGEYCNGGFFCVCCWILSHAENVSARQLRNQILSRREVSLGTCRLVSVYSLLHCSDTASMEHTN